MIGLDDVLHTSYEITRDTLRVLLRCLDPRNARDYCLKCNVPPFLPSANLSEKLKDIEENLIFNPDATTAQDLADLLRVVDELADALTSGSGARDRGIQFAIHLMLPAMLHVTSKQRGVAQLVHVALLIVSLTDQRLMEAYPETTTHERLAQIVADVLRAGKLTELVPDPADPMKVVEEWRSDVLMSLLAPGLALVTVIFDAILGRPIRNFFDYGFDHPDIEGLEEALDSAHHAFAVFIPGDIALEQADYAAFEPQAPPFRKRDLVLSSVPLIGNDAHGGGLWLQADQDLVFESETATRRIAFTVRGQGGALIALPAQNAINGDVLGALSAKFQLRVDDPDAAGWSNTEIPKGISIRARRLSIQIEAGAASTTDLAGTFDVSGTARVEQAELVVGKLPLIGSLVKSGFRIAFDAGLVGSLRRRELRFEGGLATELVIPINRKIPIPIIPLTVRSVTVRVAAQTSEADEEDAKSGLTLQVTANLSLSIGKVITAHADGLGFEASFGSAPQLDGNLAGFVDAGWKPVIPNGVGLSIGWRSVRGSGFIGYDPATDRLSGSLSLDVARFKLKGLAVSDPTPDGKNRSWMIVASLEFPTGGGGGITFDGVGLLFGSNRRSDPDAFLAGLGAGHLDAIVLPGDPVPRMAALTAALGALFPPSNDATVIGVIFKIGALGGKLKAAFGLIIEDSGDTSKYYIVVRVLAAFPSEDLATLRIEAHGVAIWDTARDEFNLRIVLRNSKLFGGELTGEASAFYGDPDLEDGNDSHTWLVSFGGFNPRYQVPGGRVYVPKPLQLTFARGDNLKIELRLYFAITPGAVHFGASVDLVARFSGFGIHGRLTIDVLLTKFGLKFIADISFTVELKLGSRTLAGIAFKGTLKGFYPAELSGRVSVSFLFWTWTSPRIVATLEVREEEEEGIDASPMLVAAIRDTRNWDGGGAPGLMMRPGERAGVWLSPSAPLTFRQAIMPLERTITRCGSASLPAPTTFTAEPVKPAGARWSTRRAENEFAPGLYVDLSEEESLSVTSFVSMPAGFVIERPFIVGPSIELDTEYELVVIDSANPKPVKDKTRFSAAVMGALAECAPSTRDGSRQSPARPLVIRPDKLAVVTETLAPVAISVDYLEAISRVRSSGDSQRIVSPGEAA
jgi:uncharacterized protein DUF6603